MGQKIHPIGFRVGIIRDWDSKWYIKKGYATALVEDTNIRNYIKSRLGAAAISKIEIERPANKIKITLHTARPGIIIGKGGKGVEDLRTDLEKRTGKSVNVNVQEVRRPELEAQLVAEGIASQIERRISHKRAMRQSIIRTMRMGAKGIKTQVSGRLGGSEMARRESDKQGKIPLHTIRADIDYGFAEAATTYGNIGVKVWIYRGDILPGEKVEAQVVERQEQPSRAPRSDRRTERRGGERRGGERRGGARRTQQPHEGGPDNADA